MKKIIYLVLFLAVAGAIYYIYNTYTPKEEIKDPVTITTEKEIGIINELYIYGNHLNIYGNINLENTEYKNIELIIHNNDDVKAIKCIFNKEEETKLISFNISDLINDGLYLDDIQRGTNNLFIKIEYENENDIITKYYPLKNETKYNNLTYYTLSKYNNKIIINSENDHNTLSLNVSENTEKDIYDVVIDPGHGGKDSGASNGSTLEKILTLEISQILKEKLENMGLKVKLTRESDIYLENYNDNGRIDNIVSSNAKYLFSIHLNSHANKNKDGVEIYTPNNIDYTLSRNIADNIVNYTGIDYSNNMGFKKYNGVYTRQFKQSEINNSDQKYPRKTKNSAYYFIIRETGGIVTGAYVDGSIEGEGFNKHYDSAVGIESYIIELGYIINNDDLNLIINNKDKFANAIADSIKNETNY